MKNATLAPGPEREPEFVNSDPALFDRCKVTKTPKLFDQDLPSFEERAERQPYTLSRQRLLPPFRTPIGGVVHRHRGGKGYTPIYESWRPERLLRVRGRLMAVLTPTPVGGRRLSWADQPLGWGATQPALPAPYVLREANNLTRDCTDGCASDVSAARLVESTLRANGLAGLELGPRINEGDESERLVPPWTAEDARQIRLLELKDALRKADASKHRVKTLEHRNEDHGEYGPQSRMTRDGRVAFGRNGLPALNERTIQHKPPNDHSQKRSVRLRDDQTGKVNGHIAVIRLRKPGPKPEHGFPLDERLRKIKSRCKKRGIPFILAQHLNNPKKAKAEHEQNS